MTKPVSAVAAGLVAGLRPKMWLSLDQWMEKHFRLSAESSAEPGPFRFGDAEYQRGIAQAITDPAVDEVVFMASSQVGKALDVATPVPTPGGWATMGALRPGDLVFDDTGRICCVVAVSQVWRQRPCYAVTFEDGDSIVADAAHLWPVQDGQTYTQGLRTTADMALVLARPRARRRLTVPLAGPLECVVAPLPLDPYVLGAWLGDGTSAEPEITVGVQDAHFMRGALAAAGVSVRGTLTATAVRLSMGRAAPGDKTPNPVLAALREMAALNAKHIPPAYLRASAEQRWALLQGLMDTDGCTDVEGGCEFVTTSQALAHGMDELLSTLGVKFSRAKKTVAVGNRPAYRFRFKGYAGQVVFRMPRKQVRVNLCAVGGRARAVFRRAIVSVLPVAPRPTVCIEVDSPSRLFLAGRRMVPTHNSTLLRGCIGYFAEHQPSPVLVVLPSEKVAVAFGADFVEPLIRDTPVLTPLFQGGDGRAQTGVKKSFPGGTLTLVGANVPSSLAMRPIRVVLGDEVDRWPVSSGKEGSPVSLATARTKTYRATRKHIWVSTPTRKETSVITGMFETTDKRLFHVRCEDCNEEQPLVWDQVQYKKGAEADAAYCCKLCGSLWTENTKRRVVRAGRWVATAKSTKVGFHLSELYSPWSSMAAMAKAFEAARGNPNLEQAFHNTSLGLPWSGDLTSTAQAALLVERREKMVRGALPPRAALITAGVDVQRDRIEVAVCAWGPGEEVWILDHQRLYGDPSGPRLWADLDQYLQRGYMHPLGVRVGIEVATIDTGYMAQSAYDFCNKAQSIGRSWLAIKGQGGPIPIWRRSKMKFKDGTKLYIVGTDDAKQRLYASYQIDSPGPGYVHIPDWLDETLLDQMTAEWCRVEHTSHGFPQMVWEKKPGARNEMLDLLVYNTAANRSLNLDLDYRLRNWALSTAPKIDAAEVGRLYGKA